MQKKLVKTFSMAIAIAVFSSCNVVTYIQTSPNIPMVKEKGDIEGNFTSHGSVPDLLTKYSFNINYAISNRIVAQTNYTIGPSAENEARYNWPHNGFGKRDYNIALGYYKSNEKLSYSFLAGVGSGRFNLAKSWTIFSTEMDRYSFGSYTRSFLQGAFSPELGRGWTLSVGLRYEMNRYQSLELGEYDFDLNNGICENCRVNTWEDRNLFVANPVVMVSKKINYTPVELFYRTGLAQMVNWTEVHVNRRYQLVGIRILTNLKKTG